MLENKSYTEYELPGVSSHFGCKEELKLSHNLRLKIRNLVSFKLDTNCRLIPLTTVAGGSERCFAVFITVSAGMQMPQMLLFRAYTALILLATTMPYYCTLTPIKVCFSREGQCCLVGNLKDI